MKTYVRCEACYGRPVTDETCALCGGDGRIAVQEELDEEEAARQKRDEDWREWADMHVHGEWS